MKKISYLQALFSCFVSLLIGLPALAQMAELKWTYRPLVIVAPWADDAALKDIQIVLRQSRDDMADRDMVVVTVAGDTAYAWDPAVDKRLDIQFDAVALRQTYQRADGRVSIVLIGKDGDVKDYGTTPGDIQNMIDLIDTMPMRQRELDARKREAERREEINNRMWGNESFGR